MTERDPLYSWRQNNRPFIPSDEELAILRRGLRRGLMMKTCTKCSNEIKKSEKFIKITVNGVVTYRHDRKCA